jgi:hypothetical protein
MQQRLNPDSADVARLTLILMVTERLTVTTSVLTMLLKQWLDSAGVE